MVADFCYGAPVHITPFNVAALRTAAELLEMSETENNADGDNLVSVTEKYFRRVVAVNRDYASVVFRSCLELLPEAETMAVLASRCLEAWNLEDEGDGDGDITCFEDFKSVEVENFMVLASSLNRRLKCHDLIYKLALLYFQVSVFSPTLTNLEYNYEFISKWIYCIRGRDMAGRSQKTKRY